MIAFLLGVVVGFGAAVLFAWFAISSIGEVYYTDGV